MPEVKVNVVKVLEGRKRELGDSGDGCWGVWSI